MSRPWIEPPARVSWVTTRGAATIEGHYRRDLRESALEARKIDEENYARAQSAHPVTHTIKEHAMRHLYTLIILVLAVGCGGSDPVAPKPVLPATGNYLLTINGPNGPVNVPSTIVTSVSGDALTITFGAPFLLAHTETFPLTGGVFDVQDPLADLSGVVEWRTAAQWHRLRLLERAALRPQRIPGRADPDLHVRPLSSGEEAPLISFDFEPEIGTLVGVRRCPQCCRFLPYRAFTAVLRGEEGPGVIMATCPKCGTNEAECLGFI